MNKQDDVLHILEDIFLEPWWGRLLLGPLTHGENEIWRGKMAWGYKLVKGQSQSLNPGLSAPKVLNH